MLLRNANRPTALIVTLLGLLLLPACGVSHVNFRPREHVDGESPDGHAAASYDLPAGGSGVASELRVWSGGVSRVDDGGSIVHVGFEIENRFDRALALDTNLTTVVDLDVGDSMAPPTAPLIARLVRGESAIEPSRVGVVDLTFDLPGGVNPNDVRSFAVRWVVDEPFAYEQHTSFRRAPRRDPRPYEYTFGFPLFYYRGYSGSRAYCW